MTREDRVDVRQAARVAVAEIRRALANGERSGTIRCGCGRERPWRIEGIKPLEVWLGPCCGLEEGVN